jgi:NADPH-dependent 2,4-dienoyl-CoA reductase/sulfur reductase-like enzyme
MRAFGRGITPGSEPVRLHYGGQPVTAQRGDTVAAALTNAGLRACRTSSAGDDRGMFCGMGVCTECSMVVDGEPGRLACLTYVREGMQLDRQPPAPALDGGAAAQLPELELAPDVLVIGAGPAGLTAAAIAAEAGLAVVLADERAKPGGQYYKQPSESAVLAADRLDAQYRQGRDLIARVTAAGVRVLPDVAIWGAFGPDHLVGTGSGKRWILRPQRLVLATGAYERGVPLPGWTLPGVMTTGAAQTLLRANQVSPGTRVLISGNGPLNLQVAAELADAGVTVVALAELARVRSVRHAVSAARMLRAAPDLVRAGAGYALTLARARVPVLPGSAVIEVESGTDGTTRRATVARIGDAGQILGGTERSYDVDAVCVGFGFLPANEIARSLGCRHRYDDASGYLRVAADDTGRTSVPEVWAIGDSAGIEGARVARAAGVLAGAAVAADLGRALPARIAAERAAAARARRRSQLFQNALWRVYQAPVLLDQLAGPGTTICRCENLSLAGLRAELAGDLALTSGALKRLTRAGMGKCQGRYCGPVVTALAARQSGRSVEEFAGFAAQVPYRATPVDVIAGVLSWPPGEVRTGPGQTG